MSDKINITKTFRDFVRAVEKTGLAFSKVGKFYNDGMKRAKEQRLKEEQEAAK